MLARKLPPDFLDAQNIQDISNLSLLVKVYQLKPIVPMEEAVTTLQILMLLLLQDNGIMGNRFDKSFEFVLDATIERLFE